MSPAVWSFKPAAVIYCQRTGMDPEAVTQRPHATLAGVAENVEAWVTVAEEMVDLALKLSSMKAAADQKMGNDAKTEH